jgi:phosphoribosylformylglycinamidine synthase subunit PurL
LPSLGGSEYLSHLHGRVAGSVPELDFDWELGVQRLIREMVAAGVVRTAHDCGLGGLAIALAEMAVVSNLGIVVRDSEYAPLAQRNDVTWFGEAPSRVVVAIAPEDEDSLRRRCADAGLPLRFLGQVGGNQLSLGQAQRVSVQRLRSASESALRGEIATRVDSRERLSE